MKKLRITVNGKIYNVEVEVLDDEQVHAASAALPNRPAPLPSPASNAPSPYYDSPSKPKVAIGDSKTLTSPINGLVLEIPVAAGQTVKEKDTLFVLEAMKMKTNISSPQSGIIKTINTQAGATVESGQVLLTFE